MSKKQFLYFLIGIHLIFLIKQLFFEYSETKDGNEYLWAAKNLINNFTLYCQDPNIEFRNEWLTKRPFLYPCFLAFFLILSFGKLKIFYILVFFFQNIFSVFNFYLVYKLLEKWSIKFKFWTLILFCIAFVSQFIYANMIMSEIWLQTSLVLFFYILISFDESLQKWFYLSVLVIIGMSLKPVLILAAFILPIVKLFYHKKNYLKSTFVTILPIIFYFITLFINYKRVGIAEYSSIEHINALHYNAYLPLVKKYGIIKADSIIDDVVQKSQSFETYKEFVNYKKKSAFELIKQNFIAYFILHFKGVFVNFIDPGRYDLSLFFKLNFEKDNIYKQYQSNFLKSYFSNSNSIVLLLILLAKIIFLLMFIKFIFNKYINLKIKIGVLSIIFYILFLTGIIGASRFFVPLIPIYLLAILLSNKKISDAQL